MTVTGSMIQLANGCPVLIFERTASDRGVVIAEEDGPMGFVCWEVGRDANGVWHTYRGDYGPSVAVDSFIKRTGLSRANVRKRVLKALADRAAEEIAKVSAVVQKMAQNMEID